MSKNPVKKVKLIIKTTLKNLDYRAQLIIIGIVVGIFSGFASVALNFGLWKVSHYLIKFRDNFYFILLPAIGILLTVLFLKYVIRDFGGHGVPEVIYSVSMKGGSLKKRSYVSKLVGSLLTISSGGSAGPEAPVIMSGAAIGSNIAKYLRANDKIRIAAAGSGAAGAIAAIFNAPITGIIFTMEVILGEWSTLNMLPVAISSVTATVISRILNGNQIPFKHHLINVNINDIFAAVGLSVFLAFFAVFFVRTLKWVKLFFEKSIKSIVLRAVFGGLVVGVIILFFPYVKGEGYELVRILISGEFSNTLLVIFVLIVMKILATGFTLGSGGAGGVFAPCLVIGSLSGYFYFQLLSLIFPQAQFSGSTLFILSGMAGVLSGTLQAPLTGIFLIVEMTGGYDVILPLLLVSFLTLTITKLVEKHSIYQYDLAQKGYLLRPRTDARILSDINAEELLEKDLIPVNSEMLLKDLIPLIKKSHRNYFPVEDKKTGKFLGMVNFNDIKSYIFSSDLLNSIIVEEVMTTDFQQVSIKDNVVNILNKFDQSRAWSLPVVENDKFLGLISKSTILDHYRKELKAQTES